MHSTSCATPKQCQAAGQSSGSSPTDQQINRSMHCCETRVTQPMHMHSLHQKPPAANHMYAISSSTKKIQNHIPTVHVTHEMHVSPQPSISCRADMQATTCPDVLAPPETHHPSPKPHMQQPATPATIFKRHEPITTSCAACTSGTCKTLPPVSNMQNPSDTSNQSHVMICHNMGYNLPSLCPTSARIRGQ